MAQIFIDRNMLKRIYCYKRYSQDEVARKFHCSQWVISNRLRKYGITPRPKTCNLTKRKYIYNRDFFKNVTRDTAWVLGLLVSDGFIRKNNASAYFGLKLNEKDEDVIFKMKEMLKYQGPVYKGFSKLEYKGQVKTFSFKLLQICDVEVVKDLEFMGIKQAKTFKEEIPICIKKVKDESIISSFIRGVYDGDGSILFNEKKRSMCFQIVGAKELLQGIQAYLIKFCGVGKTKLTQNISGTNHFALRYRGNIQAVKILDWIYSSSSSFNRMDRKFNKFHAARRDIGK